MMCSACNPSSLIFRPFSLLLDQKYPLRLLHLFNVNVWSLAWDVFSLRIFFFQLINRHENYALDNSVEDIEVASATHESVSEDEKSSGESTTLHLNVSGATGESEQEPQAEEQKGEEDEPEKKIDEIIKTQVNFRIYTESSVRKLLPTFRNATPCFPKKWRTRTERRNTGHTDDVTLPRSG